MGANTYYLELIFISVEISSRNWWKRTYWQRSYFWIKKTRSTRKKLGCKFIRINTSNAKNGYYFDYEVGNIEAFLDEFKNKKIKELEDKIKQKEEKSNKKIKELETKLKELKDKNKNSTIQITNNFEKILKDC